MVTIIIASENTKEALHLCLLSIRKYTKAPYRVIVIDNFSTDGTLKLLEQFPWVKVVMISGIKMGERHGRALDIGVKMVRTKYFLAMDSDVEILDFNWLKDILKKAAENDAAFVGEIRPKYRGDYWGKFKERALPYCLLVKTEFFKKNNCTFVPQYRWGYRYQSDVGADILLKTRKLNHSYGLIDENIANKLFHYENLTLANIFKDKEWKDEFEKQLGSDPRIDASKKKGYHKIVSDTIKCTKMKVELIKHRIDLMNKASKPKTRPYPAKRHVLLKPTLNEMSSQLHCIGETHFKSENYDASISRFEEAWPYAEHDLKHRIMARLALAYLRNKMPKKMEQVLRTLINLKSKSIEVMYSIGSIYKENNDFENAKKFYNKVTRACNKNQKEPCAGAYFHLGEVSLKSEKISQAIDHFEQCLKINPAHQKARHYLAAISPIAKSE